MAGRPYSRRQLSASAAIAASRVGTPPSEKRTKLRPVALALDLPSEVLPTPAGPTRHRIGPVLARCCTARYSTIRSLTFSRPKWSLSRTSEAGSYLTADNQMKRKSNLALNAEMKAVAERLTLTA